MNDRLISFREIMTKERQLPFEPRPLLFRAMFVVIGGGLCAAGIGLFTQGDVDESGEAAAALVVLAVGAANVVAAINLRRWTVLTALAGLTLIAGFAIAILSSGSIG